MAQDVVTPHPNLQGIPLPRSLDAEALAEMQSFVDNRIRMYDIERRRVDNSYIRADLKQRMMTYGVTGVAGALTGVGVTLLVQRMRRKGPGPGSMKP